VGVTGSGGVTEFATVEALARKGLLRDKESSADCHGGPVHHKRLTEGEGWAYLGDFLDGSCARAERLSARQWAAGFIIPEMRTRIVDTL
jgi:hypothetical protein